MAAVKPRFNNGNKIKVRPARPADANTLLAIENNSFVSDRLSRRQMRYLLTQARACRLVAEMNGEVVGYGICLTPALPRPARLYSLAVAAKVRGQGVANKLLTAMQTALQKAGYCRWRLEVDDTNQAARQLYQRWGFNVIAALPSYYENGNNGVRMERALAAVGRGRTPARIKR